MSIWRDIPGFPNYQVTADFRFRNKETGKLLKIGKRPDGYFQLQLLDAGRKKVKVLAHRAVAMAFMPNPENRPWVNHKDGNRSSVDVYNLEWSTPKENCRHAFHILKSMQRAGEDNGRAILDRNKVMEIRATKDFSAKRLAVKYGVNISTIWDVKKNRSWKD